MSDLPAGWKETTLGEIASLVTKGTTPTSLGFQFQSSGIPFVKIENIKDWKINKSSIADFISSECHEALKRSQLAEGDVLFSIAGTIGKTALVDKDSIPANTNQAVAIIRGTSNVILPRVLMLQLAFIAKEVASKNARGGAMNNISLGDVKSLTLSIPPLDEQKRIVEKLDSLLTRVDSCERHLERVPQILKRFRQSVLAAATSGRLTEEWREENSVNGEWETVALGELCKNSFYGPRFGKNEYTKSEKGVPTIRTTDMTVDGKIEVTEDTPKVLVPVNKLELYRVHKGDLLVTRTGSIGVMAVFEDDYIAIPSAYLIRFRFSSRILPRYVFYCLMSPYGQQQLGLSTRAITQPNVNAESIKKIDIQLPSLEEQAEIVRRVENLFAYAERLEARYLSASERVARLTPSLLAKGFRGEL